MNITILGASPVTPNPQGACSGYLVRTPRTALLLDCGSGVVSQLQVHLGFHELTAVVITHMHADHFLDLVTLRYALKYAPAQGARKRPSLWLPPGGTGVLKTIGSLLDEVGEDFFDESFIITEYDPTQPLSIDDLELRFAPTVHYIPCWAVRVEANDKVAAYSADTGPGADLVGLIRDADLFICEAGVSRRDNEPHNWGHLDPSEAAALAQRGAARKLVLTHIWHEYDHAAMREAAAAAFDGPIVLAQPGQTFHL